MKRVLWISLANAAASLHYFLLVYVLSSYLGQFLSAARVGLVFGASAALMMLGFLAAPVVLTHLSVRRVSLVLALADLATLLALAAGAPRELAIGLVILQGALAPLIAYTLDLFLENATTEEGITGHMRGLFLTSGNVALVASPVLIGLILAATDDYPRIFAAAAASLAVFVVIITTRKRFLADERITHQAALAATLRCLLKDRGVRAVLIANTILQNFFLWAPVYIPLYLHETIGLSWQTLGPLFALMLLPFLLIELPMGFLEDRFRGARAAMAAGFAISGISLSAFAFVSRATDLATIAVILILTRVGAALVEITSETSFFRGVGGQDAESVSFFRMTRPLGMLMGPLIGSALLALVSLQELFIPLGVLMLLGIPFALRINDGGASASA